MKYREDHLVLHGCTKCVVMAHFPRHQDIYGAILEDIPPRARAHSSRLHASCRRVGVLWGGDHDILEATQSLGQALHQLGQEEWLGKLNLSSVAGALETSRRRDRGGLYNRARLRLLWGAEQIHKPVIEAAGDRINGRVGAVDSNIPLGQLEEDALLRIRNVDGLEASENERILGE